MLDIDHLVERRIPRQALRGFWVGLTLAIGVFLLAAAGCGSVTAAQEADSGAGSAGGTGEIGAGGAGASTGAAGTRSGGGGLGGASGATGKATGGAPSTQQWTFASGDVSPMCNVFLSPVQLSPGVMTVVAQSGADGSVSYSLTLTAGTLSCDGIVVSATSSGYAADPGQSCTLDIMVPLDGGTIVGTLRLTSLVVSGDQFQVAGTMQTPLLTCSPSGSGSLTAQP